MFIVSYAGFGEGDSGRGTERVRREAKEREKRRRLRAADGHVIGRIRVLFTARLREISVSYYTFES
jgi:hypothetical protein